MLHCLVLFAPESAPHVLRDNANALPGYAQRVGHVALAVIDVLLACSHQDRAAGVGRIAQRAFRLHECMVDEGGREPRLHHVRGRGERFLRVSPVQHEPREDIPLCMDAGSARLQGGFRRFDGRKHVVAGPNQVQGFTGQLRGLRRDKRHCVSDVARLFPHGYQRRPVSHDVPRVPGARYVLPRRNDCNASQRAGGGGVDGQKPRAGVGRPQHGAEKHARLHDVIHVARAAPDLRRRVHPREPGPDSPARLGPLHRRRALLPDGSQRPSVASGNEHGVHDLRVAGAAAEVPSKP